MIKRALLASSVAVVLGSCTIGAPPGFSSGSSWSVPLVGPLENGHLIVPTMIHDHGPYLFVVDPDSPVSQIDGALASELSLRTGIGPDFLDETDKLRPTKTAEVLRISVGTLTVRSRTFLVTEVGANNVSGRQIRGVLGRDVLADSLVFGFDRDRGMAYLATQKGFQKPEGAMKISYGRLKNRVPSPINPVSRRLATATISGKKVDLHLDLGDSTSQLREKLWERVGATRIGVQRSMIDETGTRREVTHAGVVGQVDLGGASNTGVVFVPYVDKRWDEQDIAGSLGLNFFANYAVWENFDNDVMYLVPRGGADQTKARIDRWGSSVLSACAQPACTIAELLEAPADDMDPMPPPTEGGEVEAKRAPPPARPILHVSRTAEVVGLDVEITLEARGADGVTPAGLPRLVAIFPAGTDDLTMPLDSSYAGATFAVLDVSPFVRSCPHEGACVYALSENK